jgi:outer membrane receptor for ferrienterochelin and colicins
LPFSPRTRHAALLAACLSAGAAASAAAQSTAPDERALLGDVPSVFAASKYDQPLNEAPADVTVVTRAEILRYGWLTLADVLRGVRSFLVTSDRNYAYAGVRGFSRTGDYNGRLLLLVDGHRTNDTIYDQALLGTEGPVDMDLVERVEIVRGAGSSLYGSNAFFGVINLITRRGRDIGGVEVSALAGTQSTYGGRITAGDRVGTQSEYVLSVNAGRTDGERNLSFPVFSRTNAGVASDGDADWWVKSIAKWRTGDFSLSAVYDQRTKRVPTAPFNSVFDDNRNQTTDSRAWLEARYDGVVAGGNLTARAALDYCRYEGDLVQPLTPTTINQDRSKATWWSGEVTYARELRHDLTLVAGVEVQSDLRNQQENGDRMFADGLDTSYTRYFFATDTTRYWALYAQAEWQIAPGWDATIGVRHDDYSSFGGVTDPRLALIFRPSKDLTLKAIYGQAFRAPNDYELYYDDGGVSQKANPLLAPERIRTSELLAEWRFAPQWRAVAAFYLNRISDLIATVADADGLLVNVNSESMIGRGLEGEIEGRTSFGLEAFGAVTAQLGQLPSGTPRTQLKGRLAQSFADDRAVAALETIYQSGRRTLAGTTIPAQALTNLVLTAAKLWGGLRLTAAVQNLLDASLADAGGPEHRQDRIPQPGRQFWLKIDYAFR